MEGDRHRKTGEDEVGGVVERVGDACAVAEGAFDQDDGGAERIFADQQDDEAGDDEGDQTG